MFFFAGFLLLFLPGLSGLNNGLARTPPMGWMSWLKFYCEVDCQKHPDGCINEKLYATMADYLSKEGYKDVGYEYIHIDDCWMSNERDKQGKLTADSKRFPRGIPWLANHVSIFKKTKMAGKGKKLTIAISIFSMGKLTAFRAKN